MLKLTLNDNVQSLTIDVSRQKLIILNEYFRVLLANLFKETNEKEIIIQVPNTIICKHIIDGNANGKSIYYIWHYIKCLDYWNMAIDMSIVENIRGAKYNFDKLLDIADIIGYNEHMVKIITDNLPRKYNINTLPDNLILAMLDKMRKRNSRYTYSDVVSIRGYTNMLEWLKVNNFKIECSKHAMEHEWS